MDFTKFRLLEFEHSTGTQRAAMAQDLDLICQDTGFLLLEDHDVAEHTIAAQWEVVTARFESFASEKQKVVAPYAGYPYGWLGPQQEALAASKGEKTPPDLKESFNGSPLDIPKNILDPRAYEFRINRPCGLTLVVFKERGGPIMMQSKIWPTASWLL